MQVLFYFFIYLKWSSVSWYKHNNHTTYSIKFFITIFQTGAIKITKIHTHAHNYDKLPCCMVSLFPVDVLTLWYLLLCQTKCSQTFVGIILLDNGKLIHNNYHQCDIHTARCSSVVCINSLESGWSRSKILLSAPLHSSHILFSSLSLTITYHVDHVIPLWGITWCLPTFSYGHY